MDPPPPPRQGTTDGPSVASTPPSTSLVSHRSHDPSNNLKRSDPFQFGSRHLQQDDDVFEFNAWDHVETDDAYKEYSELQYSKQRESPVSDFDKSVYLPPFLVSISAPSGPPQSPYPNRSTAHPRSKPANSFPAA